MNNLSFDVKLTRVLRLSESTLEFRFIRKDGKAVEFIPGQFFRFTFEDKSGSFERSYSLCNLGEQVPADALDLVISRVEQGRATELLFNCEEGLEAKVTGPYGRLILPKVMPRRIILICTSVGIAPFLPILDQLYRKDRKEGDGTPKVVLLFGIRSPDECIHREFLLGLESAHSSFDVRFCFSRKLPDQLQAYDRSGYVQESLKDMDLDVTNDHLLLCGNPYMVDSCFALLTAKGFRSKQVVREKYVFARDTQTQVEKKLTDAQKKLLQEKIKKYR